MKRIRQLWSKERGTATKERDLKIDRTEFEKIKKTDINHLENDSQKDIQYATGSK